MLGQLAEMGAHIGFAQGLLICAKHGIAPSKDTASEAVDRLQRVYSFLLEQNRPAPEPPAP
jgi:hypothetical protein